MVYFCDEDERHCDTCKYESVCYDSEYIKRLYDAVPPRKLYKAELVSAEDEDT